jgi:predicted transcriptional regulator
MNENLDLSGLSQSEQKGWLDEINNGIQNIKEGKCISAEDLFAELLDIGKDADSYKHLGPPHIGGA